ncbi:zinc finger protein 569-like [Cloeon dipterum]|uniref:zinc finger protein 569-like n=1 Tax=Cloeon dipterum TaxID=197152 RepID=UPI00321FFC85
MQKMYSKKGKYIDKRREKKTVWELANCKKRCFICTKPLVGNPSFLQKARTKHSNATFATCLKDIANSKFPVAVAVDDRCCCYCASLIQQRDQLEKDLEIVNNTLFTFLKASCSLRNIGNSTNISTEGETYIDHGSVVSISVEKEEAVVCTKAKEANQILYECGTCQKLFNSTDDLYKHGCFDQTAVSSKARQKKKNVETYPCSMCPSTFNTPIGLHVHARTHKKEPREEKISYQECKKCKLMFPSLLMLQEHYETHDKFRCSTCGKKFKNKEAFEEHLTIMAKLQQDFCLSCNQIFSTKEALTVHLAESHGPMEDPSENLALRVIYSCPCCNAEIPDTKSINDHKSTHLMMSIDYEATSDEPICEVTVESSPRKRIRESDQESESIGKRANSDHSYSLELPELKMEPGYLDKPENVPLETAMAPPVKIKPCVYECGMCDVRASSVNNLLEHFKTHKDQPISCKHCGIKMPSISALSKHLQYHVKPGQGIECLTCKQSVESKDQLMKHMLGYHKYKQQCKYCGEQFRYATDLTVHLALHPESRNFPCLFCNDRFSNMAQLEKHQSQEHREPKCNVCGKEIQDRKKLHEHELRHRKDLNPCSKCHRIFKTSSGLKNHMPVHTGEYKYRCDTCHKGFMNRSIFREHVNNHLEQPVMLYKCRYCEKGFNHQGSMWIHEKWHKNPFPYQCKLCGKKLRHSSILATHMRRHQGLRPYKCPHCNLSVTSSSTFKRHMMLHTGNYAYNCQECKKGFTTKHKFHQHRYSVHSIPLPAKKDVPLKISLGATRSANNYDVDDNLMQDEATIAYIVGDFEDNAAGDQGLETATDEQQQAVANLELLDENSTAWTVVQT